MIRGPRPDICIYHGPSCADGFTAAWAIWQKWGDVQFIPGVYGEAPPLEQAEGKSVLLVDFSYGEEDLRALAAVALSVTVLDHHIGAKDTLLSLGGFTSDERVITAVYDEERSGAVLAWDYAWGGIAPKMVEYVQDRDLWKFDLENSHEISAVLGSHNHTFDMWTELSRRIEDPGRRPFVVSEGQALLRGKDRDIRAMLAATTRTMIIDGTEVPVAMMPYFWASEAGHILGEGQPFAATYFDRADGKRQFSLRSSADGVDVNAIAKKFGGGGHKHAAGFTIDLDTPAPLRGRGKLEKLGDA